MFPLPVVPTPFCPHSLCYAYLCNLPVVKVRFQCLLHDVFPNPPITRFSHSLDSFSTLISFAISSLIVVICKLILPQCPLFYVRADSHQSTVAYAQQVFVETHCRCCQTHRDSLFFGECHWPPRTPTTTTIMFYYMTAMALAD